MTIYSIYNNSSINIHINLIKLYINIYRLYKQYINLIIINYIYINTKNMYNIPYKQV